MGFLDFFDGLIGGRNNLYFPGCMERYVYPHISDNYKRILMSSGIDFILLNDVCCGSPAVSAGYKADAKLLAAKNYALFRDHGVGKVITSCPACFSTLKNYEKLLPDIKKLKVEHSSVTIADAIKRGKLKLKSIGKNQKVTIHDPCHLKYYGLFDETREILKEMGFEVVEMKRSKTNSFCCGGGGGLRANFPSASKEIVKERAAEVKETAELVVTTCPLCYAQLKEVCNCKELSEVIVDAL